MKPAPKFKRTCTTASPLELKVGALMSNKEIERLIYKRLVTTDARLPSIKRIVAEVSELYGDKGGEKAKACLFDLFAGYKV